MFGTGKTVERHSRRVMSPTVFREEEFRFHFFSREEPPCDIHVFCPDGEAKFWLEPDIALARNVGMNERQLRAARKLIEERSDGIRNAWRKHFGS